MASLLGPVSLSEFSNLCRLCGSKTSCLMGLHIFEREGDLRQIYKKITECLPIQVHNSDKLPKMVCEECVYKLDDLFEFRVRSAKTEYALNEMLKNVYICTDDPISIPMETLICDSSQHHSIKVDMNEGGEGLESIVLPRLENGDESVKCEPGMLLKVDAIRTTTSNFSRADFSAEQAAAEFTTESTTDSESVTNQLTSTDVDHSDVVSLTDTIDAANLQVQNIGGLEVVKSGSVAGSSNNEFVLSNSSDGQWFFCDVCGKPCGGAQCEAHWKKCTICGVQCITEDALIIHLREAHSSLAPDDDKRDPKKDQSKTCPECGKEYRTNYKLAEHMRRHTGEKPFKCCTCDKAFRSKIGLAQHEAKHTGQYDYSCSTCGKGFQCKSYLIVHQRVHSDLKPYPCDTCGRNFKTKQSLLDHQNRHLGVKPYLCEICGRGFITKGLCKSHQKVHSGTDNRQYPCQVCNKLFVSKSYLSTHLRIHTGEKPFMCEVCGKGFLTRVDLRIHSTMHTGEKSFVCEVCGKAFARRDALRCHRRSHTGERPYRCDICGQSFTQFSPMAIHKRLHTGERPYECDVCQKTFVSKSTMMSHRKKHGGTS